jgi:hypothetical protein
MQLDATEETLTGMRVQRREMPSIGLSISISNSISISIRIPEFPEHGIVFVLRSIEASLALPLSPSHRRFSPLARSALPKLGTSREAPGRALLARSAAPVTRQMPLLSRPSGEEVLLRGRGAVPACLSFPPSLSFPFSLAILPFSFTSLSDS